MRDTHLLSVTLLMIADQVNVSRWGDDRQWACRQRERESVGAEKGIFMRGKTQMEEEKFVKERMLRDEKDRKRDGALQ